MKLTDKQKKIFTAMSYGASLIETSKKTGIIKGTIEYQLRIARRKYRMNNVALICKALREGDIE
jgi:DNA-binding CsgD family transcriptional regulator